MAHKYILPFCEAYISSKSPKGMGLLMWSKENDPLAVYASGPGKFIPTKMDALICLNGKIITFPEGNPEAIRAGQLVGGAPRARRIAEW